MFDFAWSEIALIGAVALIAIGPKDMPAAIRTITGMIKKARRMAAEFQTHVDEMIREADLGDVKKAFNEVRNFDIAGTMERTIDPDRSLRKTFQDDPFKPTYPTAATPAAPSQLAAPDAAPDAAEVSTLDETVVATLPREAASTDAAPADDLSGVPATGLADAGTAPALPVQRTPDWLPPNLAPTPKVAAIVEPPEAPAWIPPAIVAQRRDKA